MRKHIFLSSVFIIILILLTGCAETVKEELPKVFYPPAPELPRLQFLTSFTGEKDIVRKKSRFEAFITGASESHRRLDKPYGIAIRNGKLYVCDTNQGVIVFDLENRTYGPLPGARGMGTLQQPVNIRIAPDGMKYVSDPVRGQVVVFDKNDLYVTAFGNSGVWKPVDAVPFEDELFVADMKNSEIAVVNRTSGAPERRFGTSGAATERIGRPTNLAFDQDGHLFVSDFSRFQVLEFDRDGHYLGVIGEIGKESGTFSRPKGIAVDRQKRLYVVDAAFGNVQIFNQEGYLLFFFGTPGKGRGQFDLPSQVVVDYDNVKYFKQYADPNFDIENLIIVANQFGDSMINVFGMGKERGKQYPTDAELLEQLKARLEKAAKEQKPAEKTSAPAKEDR